MADLNTAVRQRLYWTQRWSERVSVFGTAVLLTFLHLFWYGYSFGLDNHAVQIPFVHKLMDPSLFPNDLAVDMVGNYPTLYYRLVALIGGVGIEPLFFALHLLFLALIFHGAYHLGRCLVDQHAAGIFTMVAFCSLGPALGTDQLMWTYHTHTSAVVPLLLWSLVWCIQGRALLAFAAVGVSFYIHMQAALFLWGFLVAVQLWDIRARPKRWQLVLAVTSLVFAAPMFVWSLSAPGVADGAWVEQIRFRSAHHSFPGTWPTDAFINFGLWLVFGLLNALWVWRAAPWSRVHRWVAFGALGWLGLCFVGWLGTEVWAVPAVVRLQLFRCTKMMTILVLAYSASACVLRWELGGRQRILAILNGLTLLMPLQGAGTWWIPVVILANVAFDPWQRLRGLRFGAALVALMAFIYRPEVSNFSAFSGFEELFVSLWTSALGTVLLGLLALWLVLSALVSKAQVRIAGSAIVIVFLLLMSVGVYERFSAPMHELSPWVEVQKWANKNTAPDARFLTPPQISGFRVFAKRTTYLEWKDGTLQYFSPDFSTKWMSRIERFQDGKGRWRPWDTAQLHSLAKSRLIDYVVTLKTVRLPLQEVFGNRMFRVYRMTAIED